MFRTLRDGSVEPTATYGTAEINKVEADFKKLTLLSKESNILQKKL